MTKPSFLKLVFLTVAVLVVAGVGYAGLVIWREITEPETQDEEIVSEEDTTKQVNRTPEPPSPTTESDIAEIDASVWEAYRDDERSYELKYPRELTIYRGSDRIVLYFPSAYSQGSNLHSASIYIFATTESLDKCAADRFGKPFSERVILNDVPYYKHHSFDSGHGSQFEFLGYTTYRQGICYDLILEMFYSVIGGTSEYRGPEFDREEIVSYFNQIVSAFQILE